MPAGFHFSNPIASCVNVAANDVVLQPRPGTPTRYCCRDRDLLLADVRSWAPKPCRCLFHITTVIPNSHFIPSSLLFSITNTKFALIGGCFQALLPPNSAKRACSVANSPRATGRCHYSVRLSPKPVLFPVAIHLFAKKPGNPIHRRQRFFIEKVR